MELLKKTSLVKDVRDAAEEYIKDFLNLRTKNEKKYIKIEHVINAYKKGYCPTCQGWLSSPDHGKFDEPFTCNTCNAKIMHHELVSSYLWSIINVVEEKIKEM
jgi:hypothetical protein